MAITAAAAADLAVLARGGEPASDLAETVRRLAADVGAAVRSYLGLVLIVTGGEPPTRLMVVDTVAKPAAALTSLALAVPSTSVDHPDDHATLVLYAGDAGAFVDLAADLSYLTGLAPDDFAIDQDLAAFGAPRAGATMRSRSILDQAIGVLIGRGNTCEQADAELDARAAADARTRHDVAASILNNLVRVEPDPISPPA